MSREHFVPCDTCAPRMPLGAAMCAECWHRYREWMNADPSGQESSKSSRFSEHLDAIDNPLLFALGLLFAAALGLCVILLALDPGFVR